MKKIILWILILSGFLLAQQDRRRYGGNAFNKSFDIDTLTYSAVEGSFTGYTEILPFTRVTNGTGGNRADYYTYVWLDSNEVITNGTFDSDSAGFVSIGTPTTFEWVASGGGFTGAVHVVTNSNTDGMIDGVNSPTLYANQYYAISFDINVTTLSGTLIYQTGTPESYIDGAITETGVVNASGTINSTSNYEFEFLVSQFGIGNSEFYVDNVSLIPIADSTAGLSYTWTNPPEDTSINYMGSARWQKKDKSYAMVYSDVGTGYSAINSVNFVYTNGDENLIETHWLDESDSEIGYEVSYRVISGGAVWTIYDTSAIDAQYMTITGLSAGEYQVRIRTLGTYVNSSYSPTWEATVTEPVDLSDNECPQKPTNVDAINIDRLGGGSPIDSVALFTPTNFTNLTNIGLDSLCISNGLALTQFDSAYAYANGDSMRIGALGDTVTAYTRVFPNDTIYVIKSSSGSYATTVTCSLTIGGVLKLWTVRTSNAPASPVNIWYVDRDTPQKDNPSGQDGRSWATAWQDLDSIGYWTDGNGVNWNIISAGDTIYMSGGTDSTRYSPKDHTEGINIYGVTMVSSGNYSFAGGDPVVIAPSWEANHNGDVYFYTDDNIVATGTATSTQTNRLVDNTANFQATLEGKRVWNVDSSKANYATIDTVVSTTILALSTHIIASGEDYRILNQAQRALDIVGVSNVKFVNMNFYNMQNPLYSTSNVVSLGDASNSSNPDSLIMFDGCTFYTRGANAQLGMGSTKTTVQDCVFDMETSDFINDNDAMGFSGGLGGHTIDNNTFYFRNGDVVGSAHRDCMQWSNIGQTADTVTRYTTTISNNLVIDNEPNGTGWNAYIYSSGPYANQTFYIYNNIFVNRKEDSSPVAIFMYHPGTAEFDSWKQSYHVLNNTFIMKGRGSGPITLLNSDTTVVKNNIFVVDTTNNLFYSMDGTDGFPVAYKDLDYNLFAEKGGVSATAFGFENGNNRTYTEWLTYESNTRDANSDTMDAQNLTFVSKYDTLRASYYVTSSIGNGTDLSATYPFLANDALGNPRSATGWLGALDKNDYGGGMDKSHFEKSILPFIKGDWEMIDWWRQR